MTDQEILKLLAVWPKKDKKPDPEDRPSLESVVDLENEIGNEYPRGFLDLVAEVLNTSPDVSSWTFDTWMTLIKVPPVHPPKLVQGKPVYSWADGQIRNFPMRLKAGERKFTSLTESDKAWIKKVYQEGTDGDMVYETYSEKQMAIMAKFGISPRSVTYWVKALDLNLREKPKDKPATDLTGARSRKLDSKKFRIFSCAQNATPVNKQVWTSLLKYVDYLEGIGGCSLHVIPFLYHNPTSLKNDAKDPWWASQVLDHLDLVRHEIHDTLTVMADIRIQPTAEDPVGNVQVLSGAKSCIFAHTKQQMLSIPVLEGQHRKIAFTTGAVTSENYTPTIAGKKGEFHHQYGFVIVEHDDDNDAVYVRQVPMRADGTFCDLVHRCDPVNGVTMNEEAVALVLGDLHIGEHDQNAVEAVLPLAKAVACRYLVLHDLFNGASVNPHERKDPFLRAERFDAGETNLQDEITAMIDYITWLKINFLGSQIVAVRSNHDDMLDRHLKSEDWKSDVQNARAYMKYSLAVLEGKAPKGVIPYVIGEEHPDVVCLGLDESFQPGAYELAHHGHIGANGSKGTYKQYARFSAKTIIGHSHAPVRHHGCIQVGTSTRLRVRYNTGASSWRHCHAIEHTCGTAQHILLGENYKFTTFLK
jgi:hypothetical protein